jgi:peptidoglycan hydrolase-like protein with peptidoglycan-binding domain
VYPAPAVDDKLVLRTTDEHCAGWPEASLVQAILIRRGYDLHVVDGVWDDEEIEEIKMFQRNHGLEADGIVGPKTWAELLKR